MMTDRQLAELFTAGSAPERDATFALWVASGMRRARRRLLLLALARRALTALMLAATVFLALRLLEVQLAQLLDTVPRFMGVPLPVVLLGLLVAGLTLRGRLRLVFLR